MTSPTQPSYSVDASGAPIFGSTSTPVLGSSFSLWDIPKELTDYLNATSNGKLWFDIGQRDVGTTLQQSEYPTTGPASGPYAANPGTHGDQGVNAGVVPNAPTSMTEGGYDAGSANAAEHDTTTHVRHRSEAYDIMTSPTQVMAQVHAMQYSDPARFLQIQEALANSPFGTVHVNGVFDHNTEVALGQAMLQYVKLAMGTGTTPVYTDPTTGKTSGGFVAYLLNTAATAQANGGAGTSNNGTGSQAHINLDNPAQIRDAAQNAAAQALGHGLTNAQLNAFVTQFQTEQLQRLEDGYTASLRLPGEAMSYVQSTNQKDFQQNQETSYMDALVNMFAPSQSQRPNQNPVEPLAGTS